MDKNMITTPPTPKKRHKFSSLDFFIMVENGTTL